MPSLHRRARVRPPGVVRRGDRRGERACSAPIIWASTCRFRPPKIALGLNFDAIPPIGVPQSVNVTGAERTSFYPTVTKTATAFGFEIQADAEPGAGHYYRSDHFSLARAGVPAFSINTGVKFAGHPPEWGKAQRDEYTAKHYHNPSDEYSPSMDFSSDAALAKFGFALGWQAMLAKDTVNWLPGDEFEATRLHRRWLRPR